VIEFEQYLLLEQYINDTLEGPTILGLAGVNIPTLSHLVFGTQTAHRYDYLFGCSTFCGGSQRHIGGSSIRTWMSRNMGAC
jgi:hypothetical protein